MNIFTLAIIDEEDDDDRKFNKCENEPTQFDKGNNNNNNNNNNNSNFRTEVIEKEIFE